MRKILKKEVEIVQKLSQAEMKEKYFQIIFEIEFLGWKTEANENIRFSLMKRFRKDFFEQSIKL